MAEMEIDINEIHGKTAFGVINNQLVTETVVDLLIQKGVFTREEYENKFKENYNKNAYKYGAEFLEITEEEYRKLSNKIED